MSRPGIKPGSPRWEASTLEKRNSNSLFGTSTVHKSPGHFHCVTAPLFCYRDGFPFKANLTIFGDRGAELIPAPYWFPIYPGIPYYFYTFIYWLHQQNYSHFSIILPNIYIEYLSQCFRYMRAQLTFIDAIDSRRIKKLYLCNKNKYRISIKNSTYNSTQLYLPYFIRCAYECNVNLR